jgi:hypothetical protein
MAGLDHRGSIGLLENRGSFDRGARRQCEPRPHGVSRQPPGNHTFRDPVFALSSELDASGANTEKSNAGRRPIAATRSDTMRTASPEASG